MTPSTESRSDRGESHDMYHAPSSGSSSSSTNDTAGSISAAISTKVSLVQNELHQSAEDSPRPKSMSPIDELIPTIANQDLQRSTIPQERSHETIADKALVDAVEKKKTSLALSCIKSINSYSELERQAHAHLVPTVTKTEEARNCEEVDSCSSEPSRIFVPSHSNVTKKSPWREELSADVQHAPSVIANYTAVSSAHEPATTNAPDLPSGIPATIDVAVRVLGTQAQSKNEEMLPLSTDTFPDHPDMEDADPTPNFAHSSSTPSPPGSSKGNPSLSLRRGKWTIEEESYVARVIQDFNSGYLNAPAGTTLRSYLSDKLHCDPMRITKKFTGDSCIGKRVFHPAVRCPSNAAGIDKAQAELDALERRWRRRMEMQQRESAKKAAASAAAVVAGRAPLQGVQSTAAPNMVLSAFHHTKSMSSQHVKESAITRTASWLDRANAILTPLSMPLEGDQDEAIGALPVNEIENQMKAVERLLHEGPIIQQTTAGLPLLLDQDNIAYRGAEATSIGSQDSIHPPRDKRPRRLSDTGAEDAEALLGFVNTVRAAAAGRNGSE